MARTKADVEVGAEWENETEGLPSIDKKHGDTWRNACES